MDPECWFCDFNATLSLSCFVSIVFINPFMPKGIFNLFGQIHFLYKGCLVSFYYYHGLQKILYLMQTE